MPGERRICKYSDNKKKCPLRILIILMYFYRDVYIDIDQKFCQAKEGSASILIIKKKCPLRILIILMYFYRDVYIDIDQKFCQAKEGSASILIIKKNVHLES